MIDGQVLMVVPTLGTRRDWLIDALRSILDQETDVQPIVRVVAPDSAPIQDICDDLGVELLRSNRRGLSAAINDGWNSPHEAEFVAWLGDDDLLAPESLLASTRHLEEHPKSPAVYGQVRYIDEDGATLWVQRPGIWGRWYFRVGKNLIPQQGSLFRWAAVQQIGGIDELYQSAMDQDLFARLQRRGRLHYVRRELAAFRLHASNITVTKGEGGNDEGDEIRGRYFRRGYPVIRSITRRTDRLIYALIRRMPYRRAADQGTRPYTASSLVR
ncbi:glycosyltransferase [Microbacterium sp. zg-YB36]|uniref:glycosyltransferase family 2 protein n=1 Tax=Microbacterium sp. zg-YB36 TaxID=2969407 RepID=UPI00214CF0CA|nr:glycosyltransferase [Microbacterium sp. zg-YB36]MDL5352336.1 glycosyltransferase [Microbacterium sp. zg-YB36]